MGYNKVIIGGELKLDLSSDDVIKEKVLRGYQFHNADGDVQVGICDYDSDTTSATATASTILEGETAFVKGFKITGSMPNNSSFTGTITSKGQQISIPVGFHPGTAKIGISTTEQNKLIASNIKDGITILGVRGTLQQGTECLATSAEATPSFAEQTILPPEGFTHLTEVKVNPIPYREEATAGTNGTTIIVG